jgi:hypothetical protein
MITKACHNDDDRDIIKLDHAIQMPDRMIMMRVAFNNKT